MAKITAADVNKLRKATGAGMMDCKKALVEAEGDFDAAISILRKKGQKIAEKRASMRKSSDHGRATNGDKSVVIAKDRAKLSSAILPNTTPRIIGWSAGSKRTPMHRKPYCQLQHQKLLRVYQTLA